MYNPLSCRSLRISLGCLANVAGEVGLLNNIIKELHRGKHIDDMARNLQFA